MIFLKGFNVETVEYKNVNFTVWDVGGRDKGEIKMKIILIIYIYIYIYIYINVFFHLQAHAPI